MKPIHVYLLLVLLGGCARAPQSVFEPPAAPSSTQSVLPGDSGPLTVSLLSPRSGDPVSQLGTLVRFRLNQKLPVGSRPMVFLRDATGLDATNWWAMPPPSHSGSDWECPVQFGEARDNGARFAIAILVLPDENLPAVGLVGNLPDQTLASSSVVEVIRK